MPPPPRPLLAWTIALVVALTSVAIVALVLLPRTWQALSGRSMVAAVVSTAAIVAISAVAVRARGFDLVLVGLAAVGALVVALSAIPWRWGERVEPIWAGDLAVGGDIFRSPERLWPGLALGAAVLGAAWLATLARRGVEHPHVRLVLTALTVHSVGMVLVALSVGEVTAGSWVKGRPHRVGGRRLDHDKRSCVDTDTHTDRAATRTVGEIWLEAADDEHESIGAFEDLAARLTALGAPDHLVQGARRAAADEVRHTRICRRIAADLGATVTPASAASAEPDAVGGASRPVRWRSGQVVRLAVESYLDGVIGEGQAAGQLERGAETTKRHGALLRAMARDERRHAALGADVVRWCASQHPRLVHLAVARVATKVPAGTDLPASYRGHAPAALRDAGLVDRTGAEAVWRRERRAALGSAGGLHAV